MRKLHFSRLIARTSVLMVLAVSGCITPSWEAVVDVSGMLKDLNGQAIANQPVRLCAITERDVGCDADNSYSSTCIDTTTDGTGRYSDQIVMMGGESGHCYNSVGLVKLYIAVQAADRTVLTDQNPDLTNACFNSGSSSGKNIKHCRFQLTADFDARQSTPNTKVCAPLISHYCTNYELAGQAAKTLVIPLLSETSAELESAVNNVCNSNQTVNACLDGAQINQAPNGPSLFLLKGVSRP